MREEPIRVLHVLGKLNMGGAESRIMDLYRHIDRTKVQFDFLSHYQLPKGEKIEDLSSEHLATLRAPEFYDEEIRALGGRIYVLPRFTGLNIGQYRKAARKFFRAHHDFAVVEGHMTSMASVYLPIAKKEGVPVTMAHARSAGVDAGFRGLATRWMRRSLADRCDVCLSCSKAASAAVYGQKAVREGRVQVIPNALDVQSFYYDPARRQKIRQELGIPDIAIVLGHVGRFDIMKNQTFLADIVEQLCEIQKDADYRCLFVGSGDLEKAVRAAFAKANLEDRAIFAGQCDRDRTVGMYQAFDAFVFPSLYEGLPGTVIEAQAAGLPCLISDRITDEVCVTDNVCQYSLQNVNAWADKLQSLTSGDQEYFSDAARSDRSAAAIRALGTAGYDIVSAAVRMQQYYLQLAGRK